ncbi:uncharacterized protein LOC121317342 [Polyodon spathula]|uniref:uncharacterized protein LOC121317342 n=1 Tax=Polyodon spathula TaxID=7913 RepID=UPI001B7E630C|nr:uncharacterized protein LOC121317342 [Polyodon spathula]
MVAAIRKLSLRHMPYFAHTLNLILKDSVAAVADLEEIRWKVKKLMCYFRTSTVAKENLPALQHDMKQQELKLIQEVETRWNSTFLMLEHFLAVKDPVSAAMSSLDASLPVIFHQDWTAMDEAIKSLKPFFVVTEMSAEKHVTAYNLVGDLNRSIRKRCEAHESRR